MDLIAHAKPDLQDWFVKTKWMNVYQDLVSTMVLVWIRSVAIGASVSMDILG
jgi:hypothetical protein